MNKPVPISVFSNCFKIITIILSIYSSLTGQARASDLKAASLSSVMEETVSFETFCNHIHYHFNDKHLLELATTHNSEDLGISPSLRGNERLEFLGDALLEFGLRIILWNRSPISFRETLPTVISSLAENTALAQICDHIYLDKVASFPAPSVLNIKNIKRDPLTDAKADRLEALLGAIFIDNNRNMETIVSFIKRFWFSEEAPCNFSSLFSTNSVQDKQDQDELCYAFKDPLLRQYALGERPSFGFLSKGLLKCVLAEFLYNRFPDLPEGELTKRINFLMAKKSAPDFPTLRSHYGPSLDINAIVASVYLDNDFEAVTDFILWHWVNPKLSVDINEALKKEKHFSISRTASLVSPIMRRETSPKGLLIAIFSIMNQVPEFVTEEKTSSPAGYQSFIRCLDLVTEAVKASTKKEAERLAAERALEELVFTSFERSSVTIYSDEFFTKVLELYIQKHFCNDFKYHIIAKHPLKKKYRLEVQGTNLASVISEGESLENAKYQALRASLLDTFKERWQHIKMATTPVLSLPESLKVYERFCRQKLSAKEKDFAISALSKGKEKLSPLLVYEISLPSLGCSLKGEGHSKEVAEFDCIVSALDHLDSLS